MDATIPRSLPVITGLPCKWGLRDCSQDAKKASPSIWRMARGNECSVSGVSVISVFANRRDDYSSNLQLLRGIDRLVFFVGGLQPDLPPPLAQILHGPPLVDLDNDNIPVFGIRAPFDQHQISRQEAGFDHGIPGDFEHVGGFFVPNEELLEVHRIASSSSAGEGKPASTVPNTRREAKERVGRSRPVRSLATTPAVRSFVTTLAAAFCERKP